MTQYGNRLVIPNKADPSDPRNLEAIERWANSLVVNKIVAGTGVTLTSQAQAYGTGAQGSGVVTINAQTGSGKPAPPPIVPLGGSVFGIAVPASGVWILVGNAIGLPGVAGTFPMVITTNQGATWTGRPTSTGLPATLQSVAAIPNGATYTIMAGDLAGNVWVSTDGGATWASASVGTTGTIFSILHTSVGWFCTDGSQVYKSTNTGVSWAAVASISAAPGNPGVLAENGAMLVAVGTAHSVYSTDSGATWHTPAGVLGSTRGLIVVSPTVWLAVLQGNGVYETVNQGASWALLDGSTLAQDAWYPAGPSSDGTRLLFPEAGAPGGTIAWTTDPYATPTLLTPDPGFANGRCAAFDGTGQSGKWLFGGEAGGTSGSPLSVFNAQ